MKTLFEAATPNPSGYRDVRPAQVFADENATRIVDVREPHEFSDDLGHIQGAELVPLGSIDVVASGWSKDQAVVVVCRSGRRSERAVQALTAGGFRRAMNMVGGMLAWNEARLPVEGAAR